MMPKQMQFPCKIGDQLFTLELTSQQLEIRNDQKKIALPLTLDLIITWLFYGDKICGFKVENIHVEGEWNDMQNLKHSLGTRVTFTGIQFFYSLKSTIYQNKNCTTKISQLVGNNNYKIYACKSFKKCNRGLAKIHSEINLLVRLQGLPFIPIIYEVYESSKCVYLIMEYLEKRFDEDFCDEELKIVTYSLLQSIQTLEKNQVAHKNIKKKHIMFDSENKLKLIGFGSAIQGKITNHEFELDIFKIGTLLYKIYSKRIQEKKQVSTIPDNGADLLAALLEEQFKFRLNIDLALNHPYFNSLRGEGIQREIQSMNPKFKSYIEDDPSENMKNLAKQATMQQFLKDQSTELQL